MEEWQKNNNLGMYLLHEDGEYSNLTTNDNDILDIFYREFPVSGPLCVFIVCTSVCVLIPASLAVWSWCW